MNNIEILQALNGEIQDPLHWTKDEQNKAITAAISALEAQQDDMWIPISIDKPPKVNDGDWAVFIVPNYFGTMGNKITARYFKEQGIKHEEGWTDKRVGRATHWMPLPEPWKEEQP